MSKDYWRIKLMNTYKKTIAQYIKIFASDLQYMAGDAYAHKNIETGGWIYIFWSHHGRAVVMLASSSGPGACRETAHFAIDPGYVTTWNEKLQKMFGVQYGGNWHSHHGLLGMDHPSRGDVGQIHRLAARCNIPRMIQIVLTYEEGVISAPKPADFGRIDGTDSLSLYKPASIAKGVDLPSEAESNTSIKCSKIRINAFIYTEASKGGRYARCPLKVLLYPNPIRTALAGTEILHVPGGEHFEDFPLERIVYDELEPAEDSNNVEQNVPPVLVSQLDELSDEIASCAEIYTDKDLILVSLPLSNGCRVCVTYNVKKLLPKIHSVHFVHPHTKASIDITSDVLTGNCATLSLIHRCSEDRVRCDKGKGFLCGCQAAVRESYRIERM
jgi:hypothetical protein